MTIEIKQEELQQPNDRAATTAPTKIYLDPEVARMMGNMVRWDGQKNKPCVKVEPPPVR